MAASRASVLCVCACTVMQPSVFCDCSVGRRMSEGADAAGNAASTDCDSNFWIQVRDGFGVNGCRSSVNVNERAAGVHHVLKFMLVLQKVMSDLQSILGAPVLPRPQHIDCFSVLNDDAATGS